MPESNEPMTPAERIDYLVKALAFDNGKAFAEKCGFPATSLSKWRNGARKPGRTVMEKILAAYPAVRREWLLEEIGDPIDGAKVELSASEAVEVAARLDRLEKKMDEVVAMLRRIRDGR